MKLIKKIIAATFVTVMLAASMQVSGHSGGTDRYGCHTNHQYNTRHCH